MRPTHVQVPFQLLSGEIVSVDEGLLKVLTKLRDSGVRTYFSCQGDGFAGYISADRKSFRPLLRAIQKTMHRHAYLPDTQAFAEKLFTSGYLYSVGVYSRDFSNELFFKRIRKESTTGHIIERIWDNHWGFRTIIRWPKDETHILLQLLEETI